MHEAHSLRVGSATSDTDHINYAAAFEQGPARRLSSNLYDIPVYINAKCTVSELLMMGRGTARNM